MKKGKLDRREFIKLGAASGAALMLGGIAGCGVSSDSDSLNGESPDSYARPKPESRDFDVIIAGAGPGGCLAALRLAQQGFSVGLFDENSEDQVGRRVVLAVESEIFDIIGLPFPKGDMLAYENEIERIFSPGGKECFTIDPSSYRWPLALHLDKLTQSIFSDALKSGVEFYGGYRAVKPLCKGTQVIGANFETSSSSSDVKARLIIDATGYSAALVKNLPPSFSMQFPDNSADIVSAANRYFTIDPDAAAYAVGQGIHGTEEGWNRMGKLGVYSTFFSSLSLKRGDAYILSGCKKAFETTDTTAKSAADIFINEAGYYKDEISSAEALIRISNSINAPVANGFMAIGEAACQTVTIHASGVASSLYAGHLAAKTACNALSSTDTSIKALWPYAAAYQRSRGATIAGLDVTRQTVDNLTVEDVKIMIESGIMHKEDYVGGVLVNEPAITPKSIPDRMGGFLKHPAYLPVLIKMGLNATNVVKHYKKYPEKYDAEAFEEWRKGKNELFEKIS